MAPRTAVVVAAFNAERTIRQAVESVLTGTLACDIFVVDDASTTPVAEALALFAERLEIIRLERNSGPAAARNVALRTVLARSYDYVAIMDADDISDPERLETQAAFLAANPAVGVVGTWVRLFDDQTGETVYSLNRATDDASIRKLMFWNIGLSHATAMFRVEALRRVGLYAEDFAAAEDYELLRRIGTQYDLANIPKCLVAYRISLAGQSRRRRRRQLFDRLRTQIKYFDVSEWRAWAGAAKTLALILTPTNFVDRLKFGRRWFGAPSLSRDKIDIPPASAASLTKGSQ